VGQARQVTRGEFAYKLLKLLAVPHPKLLHNRRALQTWIQCEGAGGAYNPLNTTLRKPGSSTLNSAGVQNYTSAEQGLEATFETLRGADYAGIRERLHRNAAAAETLRAIGESPWGTSQALMLEVLPDVQADVRSYERKPITH
jgi:hypothetical protein